ncbi:MAG: hypothetical protein IT569_01605 [Leptospiraceae bacterium]|nr:hypothetical protein [Leptospiraceae bacterium]
MKQWILYFSVFFSSIIFRLILYYSGIFEIQFETADSWEYRDLAWSILKDHTFGLNGAPKMNRTPGYPAFLAVIFATLGSSQFAITGVQILLDTLICLLVVHICFKLEMNKKAIIIAVILTVTCLHTAIYSLMMMTETLYAFFITSALWFLVPEKPDSQKLIFSVPTNRIILSSLMFGFGILVRPALAPSVAMFAGLLAVLAIMNIKKRTIGFLEFKQYILFGFILSVVVVPWMLRNFIVFNHEFKEPKNPNATLFGYKTDIKIYRHFYSKEFQGYLYSNEEPFVISGPVKRPDIVKYVYDGESEDLDRVFGNLEKQIRSENIIGLPETLAEFSRITAKRYETAPRLYVTAPLSRFFRFWITPRISAFWPNTSGHNSSLTINIGFTLYSVLYVVPGFIGIFLGLLRRKNRNFFLSLIVIIVGHSWMYSVWTAAVQGRYAIPLFPLLVIGVAYFIHFLEEALRKQTIKPT